jgi:hypothetical protein
MGGKGAGVSHQMTCSYVFGASHAHTHIRSDSARGDILAQSVTTMVRTCVLSIPSIGTSRRTPPPAPLSSPGPMEFAVAVDRRSLSPSSLVDFLPAPRKSSKTSIRTLELLLRPPIGSLKGMCTEKAE